MSEAYIKSYIMSAEEAEITAKWQLGVRNVAQPFALSLLGAVVFIESLKRIIGETAPGWSFLAMDALAVAIFVCALVIVDKRVKACAESIKKRRIELTIDDGWIEMRENGERIYACAAGEIYRVEAGPRVVRLISREAGAICVPRAALPEELIGELHARLGKQSFKIYNWM